MLAESRTGSSSVPRGVADRAFWAAGSRASSTPTSGCRMVSESMIRGGCRIHDHVFVMKVGGPHRSAIAVRTPKR